MVECQAADCPVVVCQVVREPGNGLGQVEQERILLVVVRLPVSLAIFSICLGLLPVRLVQAELGGQGEQPLISCNMAALLNCRLAALTGQSRVADK